jgi:hypothetical protein
MDQGGQQHGVQVEALLQQRREQAAQVWAQQVAQLPGSCCHVLQRLRGMGWTSGSIDGIKFGLLTH